MAGFYFTLKDHKFAVILESTNKRVPIITRIFNLKILGPLITYRTKVEVPHFLNASRIFFFIIKFKFINSMFFAGLYKIKNSLSLKHMLITRHRQCNVFLWLNTKMLIFPPTNLSTKKFFSLFSSTSNPCVWHKMLNFQGA